MGKKVFLILYLSYKSKLFFGLILCRILESTIVFKVEAKAELLALLLLLPILLFSNISFIENKKKNIIKKITLLLR